MSDRRPRILAAMQAELLAELLGAKTALPRKKHYFDDIKVEDNLVTYEHNGNKFLIVVTPGE